MQTLIVGLLIAASIAYLVSYALKAVRKKSGGCGNCGCGKE